MDDITPDCECAICATDMNDIAFDEDNRGAVREDSFVLLCGHGFHPNCILPWIVRKNECPTCKAPIGTPLRYRYTMPNSRGDITLIKRRLTNIRRTNKPLQKMRRRFREIKKAFNESKKDLIKRRKAIKHKAMQDMNQFKQTYRPTHMRLNGQMRRLTNRILREERQIYDQKFPAHDDVWLLHTLSRRPYRRLHMFNNGTSPRFWKLY
jgi:hypothetical protein